VCSVRICAIKAGFLGVLAEGLDRFFKNVQQENWLGHLDMHVYQNVNLYNIYTKVTGLENRDYGVRDPPL
jgi:hypothetical protein